MQYREQNDISTKTYLLIFLCAGYLSILFVMFEKTIILIAEGVLEENTGI